jgi:hypothetical protein
MQTPLTWLFTAPLVTTTQARVRRHRAVQYRSTDPDPGVTRGARGRPSRAGWARRIDRGYGTAHFNWTAGFIFGATLGVLAAIVVAFKCPRPTVEQMRAAVDRAASGTEPLVAAP